MTARSSWDAARRRGAEAALLKVDTERPKRSRIVTKIVLASFLAGVAVTLFGVAVTLFGVWLVLP